MNTWPRSSAVKPGKWTKFSKHVCDTFTRRDFFSKLHEGRRKGLHYTEIPTDLWGSQALLGQFIDLLLHVVGRQLQPLLREKKLALGRETGMVPKDLGPYHPQRGGPQHTQPPHLGTASPERRMVAPLPDFSRVPPRYLQWGRCGGKAEPTGTGPSWGEKVSQWDWWWSMPQ